MKSETIKIKSSLYDYEVFFLEDFEQQLRQFDEYTFYVIDRNVYKLYENKMSFIDKAFIYFIDAIEDKKNMDTIMDLIDTWHDNSVRKNWKAVCIGGGITQDITTFASNIFLRNIDWYFFPTTLLSMCDSCIGGKCGINFGEYKNQLGVFYPPKKIYICTEFLDTLSEGDYLNGWGELLKFSLTKDKEFYDRLEKENQYIPCDNIDSYIYDGLAVKKHVIEIDEFEGDYRRVLNYGHTFGHALEAYTHHVIPHGQGVIWGIDVVNYIGYRENVFSKEDYLRVKKLIKEKLIKEEIIIDRPEELFRIITTDKKVKNNTIYLAIPDKISNLIIYPMEIDGRLEHYFMDYLGETHEYYNN